MQSFWTDILDQLPGVIAILFLARLTLLLSWPGFLVLEKLSPVRPQTTRRNYWYNWQITLVNIFLSPVFTVLVIVATLKLADWLALPSLDLSFTSVSIGVPGLDLVIQGGLVFLVACILGDFSYYWWHRFQHTVPFLWEIHKLHHSDEELNTTTIYRSHFLEPAGQALFRGLSIGLVLDTSESSQTLMAAVAGGLLPLLWDYLIHANVRYDWMSKLLPFFSSPQFHWIHHSKLPQHQDKNFAIWIPLYDVMFGSYYRPQPGEYPPTGLSSGEKIESLYQSQVEPLQAWWRMLRRGEELK